MKGLVSTRGILNLYSAVGHFEKPRNTRNTRKIIRFLERRLREFREFRGESWRFGIFQAFTIWVNPFSVVTCARGDRKASAFGTFSAYSVASTALRENPNEESRLKPVESAEFAEWLMVRSAVSYSFGRDKGTECDLWTVAQIGCGKGATGTRRSAATPGAARYRAAWTSRNAPGRSRAARAWGTTRATS